MKVQVIGSGGAFDTHRTNSSFLINDRILVDCGYNVFPKLKQLEKDDPDFIKNIDCIVITHMDDDHMGSLKSLLYYRYFMLGESTDIYCSADVKQYLLRVNREKKSSIEVDANIVSINDIEYSQNVLHLNFRVVRAIHHIPTFGVIFYTSEKMIAISGDTQANFRFEEKIKEIRGVFPGQKSLIFHDFSLWDAPSRQVHACQSDIRVEYSPKFQEELIYYHNDANDLEDQVFKI